MPFLRHQGFVYHTASRLDGHGFGNAARGSGCGHRGVVGWADDDVIGRVGEMGLHKRHNSTKDCQGHIDC